MTILHVSDLHFNRRWYHWLIEGAPRHDLLVVAGDLLDLNSPALHARQADWVARWTRDLTAPACLCSGNHDLEWDARGQRWAPARWLRNLAGPRVAVDGQTVTLRGWSVLNIALTMRPKGGPADVWVTHVPPHRARVARDQHGRDAGDPELRTALRRHAPRLVLCGHVHEPARWCEQEASVLLLNPGRSRDARFPNHIVIETASQSVCRITDEPSGLRVHRAFPGPLLTANTDRAHPAPHRCLVDHHPAVAQR